MIPCSVKQMVLYSVWSEYCEYLSKLNSFLENDLIQSIEKKASTKDDIKDRLQKFKSEYETSILELQELYIDIVTYTEDIIQ